MALFSKSEPKAETKVSKEDALLARYGLESLHHPEDIKSVKKIAEELVGTGLMETSLKIGMAKIEVQLPISLQRAIMEQNFIMIRQLDRISRLLEEKN